MLQDIQILSGSLSSEFKQTLNVQEIVSYISQGQQAEKFGNGQSVLLLLGPTGCGKSTTGNFLLGKKMILKQIEEEVTLIGIEAQRKKKVKVIIPEKDEEFTIGHQKESQTIILKVAEIPKYQFILCDSPGFFDSRSIEIEIANSVCLKNFIQKCKSVRPIVLIKYQDLTAARGELFKKLFDLVVNILDVPEEVNFSKFLFFYTHIPSDISIDDIQSEHTTLYQFYQQDIEQNQNQMELLKVLMKQIDQYQESLIIKPLENDSQQYLKIIAKQSPFENPSKEFTLSTSEKVNQSLRLYSQNFSNQIEQYMKDNRYQDIFEQLKTFKQLKDLVQHELLNAMYNQFLNNIKKTIENETNNILHNFSESAKIESFLAKSTIEKILFISKQLFVVDQYKTIFYSDFQLSQDWLLQEIKQISLAISQTVKENFNENIQITKDGLLKLQNISEEIEQTKEIYNNCKQYLFDQYSIQSRQTLSIIEQFFQNKDILLQNKLLTEQIDEFVTKFQNHQQIENFLSTFYQNDNEKLEFYNQIINTFDEKNKQNLQNLSLNLQSIQNSLKNLLFGENNSQQQNNEIQNQPQDNSQNVQENTTENRLSKNINELCIDFEVITLKYIGQHQQINQHAKGVINHYEKAQIIIGEFVEFAFKNLQICYEQKSQLKKMKDVLFYIDQIRKLDDNVYSQTEAQYNTIKTYLESKIKKKKQEAKSILSDYLEEQMQDFTIEQYQQQRKNNTPDKKLKKIQELFEFLEKMKWTDQYFQRNMCENTVQIMIKQLNEFLQQCVNKCKSYTENNEFIELSCFLQILENLQILGKELTSYSEIKNNCHIEVQTKILKKIKDIEKQYSDMKESKKIYELNENMWVNLNKNLIHLIQIDQLKQISEIRNQANELKLQIETFLQSYFTENYDFIQQNSDGQKLQNIIQNNELRRWMCFINNIFFMNNECLEIMGCFGKNQKPQKLNELISQIYEKLVDQYDDQKIRRGDLQQVKYLYELIKQFTNEFRNTFQSLYDKFKLLPNPQVTITNTYNEIQKLIRREEYDVVIEMINKIINLNDPQDIEDINSHFKLLQSNFNSIFENLSQLLKQKKKINEEFISSVKNNLSRIDSIFKIFETYSREDEKQQALNKISELQNLFNIYIQLNCDTICNFAQQIELKNMEDSQNKFYEFLIQIKQFKLIQINDEWSKDLIKSVETILNGQLQIINIKSHQTLVKIFDELKLSTRTQNSVFIQVYKSSKEQLDRLVNQYFENNIQQIDSQIDSKQPFNPKKQLQRIKKSLEEFEEKGIPFDHELFQKIDIAEQSIEDNSNKIIQKVQQQIQSKDNSTKITQSLIEMKNKNSEMYQKVYSQNKKDFLNLNSNLIEQYTKMESQDFRAYLQKSWQIKKYFQADLNEQFSELMNKLIQKSERFLNHFDEVLQKSNIQFESEQQITQYFKHSLFIKYLKEIDEYKQNAQINELLKRIKRINQFLMDYLNTLKQEQQQLFELHQYRICSQIKSKCNQIDLLIKCLQQGDLERQNICQEFTKIGQSLMTFEQLTQRIQEKFSISENEIYDNWKKGDFQKIRQMILNAQQQKILNKYFQAEIIDQNKIMKIIEEETQNMTKNALNIIQCDIQYDDNLNALINRIFSAEEILKDINGLTFQNSSQKTIIINQITKKIDEFIQNFIQINKKNDDIEELAIILIKIQNMAINVKHFSPIVDQKISHFLLKFHQIQGPQSLFKLGNILQNSVEGANIVNQQPIFSSIKSSQFNNLVGRQNKDYILQQLTQSKNGQKEQKISADEIKNLNDHMIKYQVQYDMLLDHYYYKQQSLKEIISLAIQEIKLSKISLKHWDNDLKQKVPKILAHICAYWTLKNSAWQSSQTKDLNSLKKPNHAQIISILILLGFEEMDGTLANLGVKAAKIFSQNNCITYLQNKLIQILTGEGKSLTLGFCSILLALLGCNVDAVCYSQYLSQRDYEDFLPMFQEFGVEKKITYGTFKQLAENIINNKGDVRELTKMRLQQIQVNNQQKEEDNSIKILLIDEVDVFFNLKFYGQTYNSITNFHNLEIEAVIRQIWGIRNLPSDEIYKNIESFKPYIDLKQKYPYLINYLDNQVKTLSTNVKDVQTHEQQYRYIVKNNLIGYKTLDSSYSFTTSYSYHTMFAYFHQNQQKQISDQALAQQIGFIIHCGNLSYALIPQSNYKAILGVSGTLNSLNFAMKQVLQKYNFKKEVYIKSMFGESNRDFKEVDMVQVEKDQDNQYIQIQSISDIAYKNKQSVLIFFKDKMQIQSYIDSQKLCIPTDKYILITEDLEQSDIEFQVRRSVNQQNIALIVREYGRGTDFVCLDPEVEKNGGVVVIQTFLSKDRTEEIQIMGRTARQSKKGKYYLVLNQDDIEKEFGISEEQIDQWRNNQKQQSLYKNLTLIRDKKQDEEYMNIEKQIEKAKEKHEKTLKFYDNLYKSNYEEIYKFINESS